MISNNDVASSKKLNRFNSLLHAADLLRYLKA